MMARVDGKECYVLPEPDYNSGVPDEFRPEAVLAWSDGLAGLASCHAVFALILYLDTLSRVRMAGCDRALLLHLLEGPVHRVFEGMAHPSPGAARGMAAQGWGLTMEQRLACLSYKNFAATLCDMDSTGPGEDLTETRFWVLEQQFILLGRQIECAVRIASAPPPGTWSELHGRYQYFLEWFSSNGNDDPGRYASRDLDLLLEYKRLLLLGIAAASPGRGLDVAGLAAQLGAWAGETKLDPPTVGGIGRGHWVIDPTRDGPPYPAEGVGRPGPRSSVLIPPPGFVGRLGG